MTLLGIAGLFGTMLLLSAVPGPIDFAVVARAIGQGLRGAMMMVVGIVLADAMFMLAAVYGLTTIARENQNVFDAVVWLSVVVLIWLGVSTFRQGGSDAGGAAKEIAGSDYSSFFAGLLLTLGDPKAVLFYMALLPAFVDLKTVTASDMLAILLSAALAVTIVKIGYAYAAIRLGRSLKNTRVFAWLYRIAGGLLVITALILAWRAMFGNGF